MTLHNDPDRNWPDGPAALPPASLLAPAPPAHWIWLRDVAPAAVDALLDDAFGADRHHRPAYALRRGAAMIDAFSFGVVDNRGALIASLQCWPVGLVPLDICDAPSRVAPMILVGPVAVAPLHQGAGWGSALMRALDHLAIGDDLFPGAPMVMIGDAPYYGRFGFDAAPTQHWDIPPGIARDRLLARARHGAPIPILGRLASRC